MTALDTLLKNDTSRNIFLKGLNGSGPAMTIASLFTKGRGSYVCVLNDQEEAGYFYHDLMQLTASNEVYFFPSAYRRAIKYGHVDPANEILRTEVLSRLQDPDASFVIVTYPDALAERVVAREVLKENTLKISVGEKLDNIMYMSRGSTPSGAVSSTFSLSPTSSPTVSTFSATRWRPSVRSTWRRNSARRSWTASISYRR